MGNEHAEWIAKAERDFDTAKYNIEGKKFEGGLFFLQQSAEKALKALYIKKFRKLFKTHNLVVLARALKADKRILTICEQLSPAYQYTRYPDVAEIGDLEQKASIFL